MSILVKYLVYTEKFEIYRAITMTRSCHPQMLNFIVIGLFL